MLSRLEKQTFRSEIFQHLDGIVTCPTAYALYEKGVLEYILKKEKVDLTELVAEFQANEGYLNVALHVLSGQGWLVPHLNNEKDIISYSTTEQSAIAFELIPLYKEVVEMIKFSEKYHPRKFEVAPFRKLERIFEKYIQQYGIVLSTDESIRSVQQQVLKHIEGLLVGPTVVMLGMTGMFHKYFMEASFRPDEFHKDPESFKKILDFFSFLGWFTSKNETYRFTEKGLFFARRASAYGVTVSYIPMMRRLDDLIFGDPNTLRDTKIGEAEKHVDREMNVWGSGGAHSTYFKIVDEIIIDIFNRPIDEQPRGILDMGCGNGAFLQHIFEVIDRKTLRGEMLEEYPLSLVGVDYNEAALKVTRANLIKSDIWAKVLWGDIGRPDVLAQTLEEDYNIDLKNLLNVRTFLDHNRIWEAPAHPSENRKSDSAGAFADRGKRISNALVEDSLFEHLKNWQPFVEQFGLLVIELHTISPTLIAKNLGKTAATAYNATHGFSDQYILEIDSFIKIAKEVGLTPDPRFQRKFPDSELATVSINLLKGE
ncbi:MAG: hypothetical protein ACI8X3_002308 [Saprospiraceae bacterium]|jgi:hypothetical protein